MNISAYNGLIHIVDRTVDQNLIAGCRCNLIPVQRDTRRCLVLITRCHKHWCCDRIVYGLIWQVAIIYKTVDHDFLLVCSDIRICKLDIQLRCNRNILHHARKNFLFCGCIRFNFRSCIIEIDILSAFRCGRIKLRLAAGRHASCQFTCSVCDRYALRFSGNMDDKCRILACAVSVIWRAGRATCRQGSRSIRNFRRIRRAHPIAIVDVLQRTIISIAVVQSVAHRETVIFNGRKRRRTIRPEFDDPF